MMETDSFLTAYWSQRNLTLNEVIQHLTNIGLTSCQVGIYMEKHHSHATKQFINMD